MSDSKDYVSADPCLSLECVTSTPATLLYLAVIYMYEKWSENIAKEVIRPPRRVQSYFQLTGIFSEDLVEVWSLGGDQTSKALLTTTC